MTLIRRTNPLGELISLRQAMDRKLDERVVRSRTTALSDGDHSALDVRQTVDAHLADAAPVAKLGTSTEQSA